jgi:hypothetical protein
VRALLGLLLLVPAVAQQGNEKTFGSPGDAVLALYNAVKSNDQQAISAIFGSNAGPILHTGDEVADKNMASDFVRRYDEMHRVVMEPDQTVRLYVGADNWPMPIPIVKNSSGAWYFDTEVGAKEILYRRIGRNENDAIEVLCILVDAQREYASAAHDGDNTKHYALKFVSTEGKQDGLYWKTSDNEPPSPIGPLIVSAAGKGENTSQITSRLALRWATQPEHIQPAEWLPGYPLSADLRATGAQPTQPPRSRLTVCCRIAPGVQTPTSIPRNRFANYWKQRRTCRPSTSCNRGRTTASSVF